MVTKKMNNKLNVDKKPTIQVRISRDLHLIVKNKTKGLSTSITAYLNALIVEDLKDETIQN